ncbi:hypothetical protein Salat_0370100 [Sesamum alatum]|uniref:Uncharacterized protein n=1 Tax=Sesamum alatum TaxID=300844 RepID=A0AAE1Z1Q2_9LAMI|nr:hypothetical protein Salat_0370100 [Sesamum alatum]
MAKFPSMLTSLSFFIIILAFTPHSSALGGGSETSSSPPQCNGTAGGCRNNSEALKLKIIAVAAILIKYDRRLSPLVFSSGSSSSAGQRFVRIGEGLRVRSHTGDGLHACAAGFFRLPQVGMSAGKPLEEISFHYIVAMLSAVLTLMVDSYAMSYYRRRNLDGEVKRTTSDENAIVDGKLESQHCHGFDVAKTDNNASQVLRYRRLHR